MSRKECATERDVREYLNYAISPTTTVHSITAYVNVTAKVYYEAFDDVTSVTETIAVPVSMLVGTFKQVNDYVKIIFKKYDSNTTLLVGTDWSCIDKFVIITN